MSSFWNRNLRDVQYSYNPPIFLSPSVPLGLGIILMVVGIVYEVLFVVVTHKG
jgi:hypothetical protein